MHRAILSLVLVPLLLATACGGEREGERTESPRDTPVETATDPAATPTVERTAMPSATAEEPAAPIEGEALVVTSTGGRGSRTIQVFGLESGGTFARFAVTGTFIVPADIQVVDGEIWVNSGERVFVVSAEGEEIRTVLDAGETEGSRVYGFAVSPDRQLLAATVLEDPPCDLDTAGDCPDSEVVPVMDSTEIRIIDLTSGDIVASVTRADIGPERFAWPFRVKWRPDGGAVVVDDITQSDAPGSIASVGIDGSVRGFDSGQTVVIPSVEGWRAAYGMVALGSGCGGGQPKEGEEPVQPRAFIGFVDLDTFERVEIPIANTAAGGRWSPDGSEFMLGRWECDEGEQVRFLWELAAPDRETVEEVDPVATLLDWYGDRAVTWTCAGEGLVQDGWFFSGERAPYCAAGDVELVIGGRVFAEVGGGFAFHGFIEPE